MARELENGRLVTTAITHFELSSGARTDRQERTMRELLAVISALPLNEVAAGRASDVRRNLERAGLGIGMADSLIAGVVLSVGAVLLTRNKRHFEGAAGLKLSEILARPGS